MTVAGRGEAAGGKGPAEVASDVDGPADKVAGDVGLVVDGEGGELDSVEDGADITGKKYGFSLSTETVHGFPARNKVNVFSVRSRTLYGPE